MDIVLKAPEQAIAFLRRFNSGLPKLRRGTAADSIIAQLDSIDSQARARPFARQNFFADSFLGLRIWQA